MPTIEKLRGRENYAAWAMAMRMMLIREGSWPAVQRVPGDVVSKELEELALATICLCVESRLFGLIMDAEDPKEVWEKLAASFQDEGLPRKLDQLRIATLFGADTTDGVRADGRFTDSGASCQMARPNQDFDGEKTTVISSEKKCTVLEEYDNHVAFGEKDSVRMDQPRKVDQSSTSTVKLVSKAPEKRLEMVAAAEKPCEEQIAVDMQPGEEAPDGPVAVSGATVSCGEASHALPPVSGQESRYQGGCEGALPTAGRLVYIHQAEFASMELYVAEFMGAVYGLIEKGAEIGDRMMSVACYNSFVEDTDRSEMSLEVVRSRIVRVWWRSDTDWGGGGFGSVLIKFLKMLKRFKRSQVKEEC